MPTFEIVEAKLWHCGAMARIVRADHGKAVRMIGLDSHRELRAAFEESSFRKSWLIDGKLAAIGGVVGPAASGYGTVWLAFSQAATRYPKEIVREARRQLDEIMETREALFCTILEGDEASERFAIFLGFVPNHEGGYSLPAVSRFGRKEIARQFSEIERIPIPGGGQFRMMAYRQIERV